MPSSLFRVFLFGFRPPFPLGSFGSSAPFPQYTRLCYPCFLSLRKLFADVSLSALRIESTPTTYSEKRPFRGGNNKVFPSLSLSFIEDGPKAERTNPKGVFPLSTSARQRPRGGGRGRRALAKTEDDEEREDRAGPTSLKLSGRER